MDFSPHQGYVSPGKRKVLGDLKNTGGSPISPTANLKLLTKVASQFRFLENSNRNTDITPENFYSIKVETKTPPKKEVNEGFEVFDELTLLCNTKQRGKGIRKFKSLGFLCDKFLALYPLNVGSESNKLIMLTDLASNLGVEKRRVYDIINVVESLQMATRIGKNSYAWTGHKKVVDMLSQLKVYAGQIGLAHYVRSQQIERKLYTKLYADEMEQTESSAFVRNSNIASFFKNERRIGILCQKFVMLFLVSLKGGLVNLELAANVLMSENCQQNKTRLRRLYDIANILVSLRIITKLDIPGEWKKPVFRYVGPSLDSLNSLNIDGSLINKLVKIEYSDENSSDLSLSEDSREPWRTETQAPPQPELPPHYDHSYCLTSDKSADMREQIGEPAAKKRLFLSDTPAEMSVPTVPQEGSVVETRAKPSPTIVRFFDQGSLPQPITDGGVYKALRVGNNIQLIRIDSA